jgi:hypothetical protein
MSNSDYQSYIQTKNEFPEIDDILADFAAIDKKLFPAKRIASTKENIDLKLFKSVPIIELTGKDTFYDKVPLPQESLAPLPKNSKIVGKEIPKKHPSITIETYDKYDFSAFGEKFNADFTDVNSPEMVATTKYINKKVVMTKSDPFPSPTELVKPELIKNMHKHENGCPCCKMIVKALESSGFEIAAYSDHNGKLNVENRINTKSSHGKSYFLQFVDECIVEDVSSSITLSEMYQGYRNWQNCNFPEKCWLKRDVMKNELNNKWKKEEKGVWVGVKLI